jgi:pimeloyl-ACP methyl ester carboxylesterase
MKKVAISLRSGFPLTKNVTVSNSTAGSRGFGHLANAGCYTHQLTGGGAFGHVTHQLTGGGAYGHMTLRRCTTSSLLSVNENKEQNADLQLSYTSFERGKDASKKPPIIIHHNLCGRKENFVKTGKQLFHLTKRNILLPDARNHGNSPESNLMSHKLMSGDIVKLMSNLKVKESSFIGFGLGGRVGMYTALVRPDLIDRLVVVSSSPVNTERRLKEWDNLIQSFYVIQTLAANFEKQGNMTTDLFQSQEFKLEASNALKPLISSDTYRAFFLSNLGKFHSSAIRTNPDLWKFPDLKNCLFKKPVLFLTGDREKAWSFSDDDIRQIRYYFPDSQFVKVSNAGFYPHLDSQDEFLEVVTSFLEADTEDLHTTR